MAPYLSQLGKLHAVSSVVCAGVVEGASASRILPVSLLYPYFLFGFPAYTACLANQHFIKILLTEYRQFSHTMCVCVCVCVCETRQCNWAFCARFDDMYKAMENKGQ